MKINGWQRLGIIASVTWALGAYFYTFNHEQQAGIELSVALDSGCREAHPEQGKQCDEKMYANVIRNLPAEREDAAIVAFAPIPFAWGFAYLAVFLFRWVRRGFAR